ncbi:MAG: hypothetical protein AAGL17_04800 [Cyanobacteria bacterium J06576_12]
MTQENLSNDSSDAEKTIVVAQQEDARFAIDHGAVALHGHRQEPPLQHQVSGQGQVVHKTSPQQPLVHMICWEEDASCQVEVNGRVTLAGDEQAPLVVKMSHQFDNDHHQTHVIEPVDHTLTVNSQLADPIHHALQLRTPLQVRFCNPWKIDSDYQVAIRLGNARAISINLSGSTVATPQPCDAPPCLPVPAIQPGNP